MDVAFLKHIMRGLIKISRTERRVLNRRRGISVFCNLKSMSHNRDKLKNHIDDIDDANIRLEARDFQTRSYIQFCGRGKQDVSAY